MQGIQLCQTLVLLVKGIEFFASVVQQQLLRLQYLCKGKVTSSEGGFHDLKLLLYQGDLCFVEVE